VVGNMPARANSGLPKTCTLHRSPIQWSCGGRRCGAERHRDRALDRRTPQPGRHSTRKFRILAPKARRQHANAHTALIQQSCQIERCLHCPTAGLSFREDNSENAIENFIAAPWQGATQLTECFTVHSQCGKNAMHGTGVGRHVP
jgi:hypothetical protein